MCMRHRVFVGGAESGNILAEPLTSAGSWVTSTSDPRKNGAGTVGGNNQYTCSTSSAVQIMSVENHKFPLEELIIQCGIRTSGPQSEGFALIFRTSGGVRIFSFEIVPITLAIQHRTNGGNNTNPQQGTVVGTSVETSLFPALSYRWLSAHFRNATGTDGFMRSNVEDVSKLVNDSINTGAAGVGIRQFLLSSSRAPDVDDIIICPRAVLVDGVASGTPGADAAVVMGAVTATAYAWESATTSSEGGGGDPNLAAGEFRLLLKAVSFGPEVTTGGFVDNTAVTVAGLTGTILINAPTTAYKQGLEPGGQFVTRAAYILGAGGVYTAGTDNADGTLIGGATSRFEAMQNPTDGHMVRHTAAGETVSVNTDNLPNQADLASVITVLSTVRAAADAANPDAIQGRIRTGAAVLLDAEARLLNTSQTVIQTAHDRPTAAGTSPWTIGDDASTGTDGIQPSYAIANIP